MTKRALLCVLPNERRAERFGEKPGRPIVNGHQSTAVVWNCPSVDEISEPRAPHDGSGLWVLYHGSIVPSRLPLTVFEALAILPEAIKLCIVGYETVGHLGYMEELRENAERLGITGRVNFVGTVPQRSDLLRWCQKCDVGLAFIPKGSDDINEQAMTGASNKPFDYAACGLALLVSDLPDWRQMYVDAGYGLACDAVNPESIAAALHWFLEHPSEMQAMGERGRRRIAAEWNYERQFSPVFELISSGLQ